MKSTVLLLMLSLCLPALCIGQTDQDRIRQADENMAKWKAAQAAKRQQAVNEQTAREQARERLKNLSAWLKVGMTKAQVIELIGRPGEVNKSVYASGTSEQWVYSDGYGIYADRKYLYFREDVLTSWQE